MRSLGRIWPLLLILTACAIVAWRRFSPEPVLKAPANAVRSFPGLTFSFRQVPAGELTTGAGHSLNPVRRFHVRAFWLATTPVTNRDYEQFDPAHRASRGSISTEDFAPVTNVGYRDARRYSEWLSARIGVPVRVANSVEWEWACYGGGTGPFAFGQIPWFESQSKYAHLLHMKTFPVATLAPNGYGLFDMTGNIQEMNGDPYVVDAKEERRFPGDVDYDALLKSRWRGLIAMKNCSSRMPSPGGCECSQLYVTTNDLVNEGISFRLAADEMPSTP